MKHDDYLGKQRNEAINTAQGILSGFVEPVEGIRKINKIRFDFEEIPEFDSFVGLDSETDAFPRGDVRKRYEKSFLEDLDKEARQYLTQSKEIIEEACKRLVEALKEPEQ